jgi:hypothetical protein
MSSTRYASTTSPDGPPAERHLASAKLRGLQIGLNLVIRVARVRSEPERRAMIWLVNFAALQRITADNLSTTLALDKAYIRSCLTDPEEDLALFLPAVKKLRQVYESSVKDLVHTTVYDQIAEACYVAGQQRKIVEVIGNSRIGKSDCARFHHRLSLDRAVWCECPSHEGMAVFLQELAASLSISTGAKKPSQLIPAIRACFGETGITQLFCDEGHRLWPVDPRYKPARVEFLREIHADGAGASVIVLATPQHSNSLRLHLDKSDRWAPAQYEGRRIRYLLPDSMSEHDLRAVARHHAPDFEEAWIKLLVLQAQACEGYCGLMVNTIDLARLKAQARRSRITKDIFMESLEQQVAATQVQKLAEKKAQQQARRP